MFKLFSNIVRNVSFCVYQLGITSRRVDYVDAANKKKMKSARFGFGTYMCSPLTGCCHGCEVVEWCVGLLLNEPCCGLSSRHCSDSCILWIFVSLLVLVASSGLSGFDWPVSVWGPAHFVSLLVLVASSGLWGLDWPVSVWGPAHWISFHEALIVHWSF